jgi:hypothetical protein
MQTAKNTSLVKLLTQFMISIFTIVILFSCTKEKTNSAIGEKAQLSPSISEHASIRTSTVAIPYDWTIFVPCANGGAGEFVHISGSTNLTYTISWTDHGFTYGYHANTYKIQGEGLTSGDTFIGSGHTEGQVVGSWVNEQWVSTFVDQIKLIGASGKFTVKNTYHVTENPDGTLETKLIDHETSCD